MKKIDLIQSLRGIAAILVVLFHTRWPFALCNPTLFHTLFGNGSIGVDLFFILSGFIMVYSNGKKEGYNASIKFIINRFIRIVPLYFIFSGVYYSLIHVGMWRWWLAKGNALFFLKCLLFIPPDFHKEPPFYGMDFVGWTLQFEMLFYMILGLAFVFNKYKWIFIYLSFVLLLLIIPLCTGNFRIDAYAPREYRLIYLNFATNPMMLEFVIGMIIAQIYLSAFNIGLIPARLFVLMSIIFFLSQYFLIEQHGFGPFRYGLSCACVVFSLLLLHKQQPINPPAALVFLGDISYSVYLSHTVITVIFELIVLHYHLPGFAILGAYYLPVYLIVVLLLSYISYSLVEVKLSNILKRAIAI